MSAQYGTITPRRTIQVPIWAVGVIALLVVAALAITVGYDRSAAPKSAVRVSAQTFPSALETSGINRLPKVAPTFPSAVETSGITRLPAVEKLGGCGNVTSAAAQPIMIGGYACHQRLP